MKSVTNISLVFLQNFVYNNRIEQIRHGTKNDERTIK